jgi:hypothetical protein
MKIFKDPRLIVDWGDVAEHHTDHIVSQETFFNVCFAVVFGSLRVKYTADGDFYMYFREFCLFWSLVHIASEYATRFNDDDLWHTIFWGGYGAGLVSTLMHLSGSVHYSLAATHIWVGIAWLRVAWHLQRARPVAVFQAMTLFTFASFIIFIGYNDLRYHAVGLFPIALNIIAEVIIEYVFAHDVRIPLNVEYHVPKFRGVCMLVMGQLVIVAATAPAVSGPEDAWAFYRDAICGVLLLLSIKLICTDCDTTQVKYHALHRSKFSRLAWVLFCQPALNFSIVTVSCGISIILTARSKGSFDEFERGEQIVGNGMGCLFLVCLLISLLHKTEPVVEGHRNLKRSKLFFLGIHIVFAFLCFILPSLPVDLLPAIAAFSLIIAKMGWLIKEGVVQARKDFPVSEGVDLVSQEIFAGPQVGVTGK